MFVVTEIEVAGTKTHHPGSIIDVLYAESSGAGCVEWCKREFQKGFSPLKLLSGTLGVEFFPPDPADKVWGAVFWTLPGQKMRRFVISEVSDYYELDKAKCCEPTCCDAKTESTAG